MPNQLFATTTGTPAIVIIEDLGAIQFTHPAPAGGYDLYDGNTGYGLHESDIRESDDFQAAIDGGALLITDQDGNPVTDLSDIGTDTKVKASATDLTPGVLDSKFQAVVGKVSLSVVNPGANEKIQITLPTNIFDTAVDTLDDVPDGTTKLTVTADQKNALNAANSPTGGNAFLVQSDTSIAQFNASHLGGLPLTVVGISPGDVLSYNNISGTFEPTALSASSAAGWTKSGDHIYVTDTALGKVSIGVTSGTEKLNVSGNIAVTGTVDGRDVSVDGTALDNHIADVTTNPHAVDKTDVGLSNVDNVQQIPLSEKGVANGVATLDASGKVPANQLDVATFNFVGNWDAATNTPTLANGGVGGNQNDVYIVSVAGTTLLDGESDWQVKDWVINTGSAWVKSDNTDLVQSVAGKTGAVTLVHGDITDFDAGVSASPDVASNSTHRLTISGNPHNVLPSDVGNTTAQWNANQIQGNDVAVGVPNDGDALRYNTLNARFENVDPITASAELSVNHFSMGRNGNQGNGYLRYAANTPSNISPHILPWPATIYKITAKDRGTPNEWRGQVRVNEGAAAVAEVIVLASEDQKAATLSVNVNEGDRLSVYLLKGPAGSGTGSNIRRPTVTVHYKRRNP